MIQRQPYLPRFTAFVALVEQIVVEPEERVDIGSRESAVAAVD
jgi:hypothetical protein